MSFHRIAIACATLCAAFSAPRHAAAQSAVAPPSLSLEEAVRFALEHHPSLAAATARAAAARATREFAEASRLPSLDVEAQIIRATGNVVAGSTFPMSGVPGISGPVGTTSLNGGDWGATTALVSAMPVTGFVRANRVTAARAATEHAAQEGVAVARLDVAFDAASAYLRVLAASATLRAAEAGVRRAETLRSTTDALVTQQLRPGADLARARAELAAAERDVAGAARDRDVTEAALAAALGSATPVIVRDTVLLSNDAPLGTAPATEHPLILEAKDAAVAASREQSVAELAWWPRVDVVGAYWARGSATPVNGVVASTMGNGLNPAVSNWALGLMVSWPILGFPSIGAQVRAAEAGAAVAVAEEKAAENAIASARRVAVADAAGAMEIARQSRVALETARIALEQAMARYGAGLSTVTDAADAQRLLARAEAADAVALIGVKAARLSIARASGDLPSLLAELHAGSGR
jgi:outer membrane protein TolC